MAALQLKVSWGAWRLKDLAFGDTAAYFLQATFWTDHRQVNIAWSPVYTVFYGAVLEAVGDVYAATVLHGLLIALAAGVLVLALMRQLLPAGIAWLVAAWWTVLPINFDTVYGVHLFSVLPILLAWLVVAAWPGPWGRGTVVAIMCASVLLTRSELLVPWALLGPACLAWDIRQAKVRRSSRRAVIVAYAVPLIAAVALSTLFYSRSYMQFPLLWTAYGPKHTVNMCQVFATGYGQRHPAWAKNPMTECAEIMVHCFGEAHPTLGRMLRSNPQAVLEHVWWNLRLTPNGVQVLLFNAMSGQANPDYFPVRTGSTLALAASLLVAVIVLAGLILLYRSRQEWWRLWFRTRAATWLFMIGTVVPHSAIIILIQRPRPAYLFDLSILLMGLVGTCLWVLLRRWGSPTFPAGTGWLIVPLLLIVPSHYEQERDTPRPLLQSYRRLAPFAELITRSDSVLLVGGHAGELAHYVGRNRPQTFDYTGPPLGSEAEIEAFLEARGVNLFYVDEKLIARLPRSSLFVDRFQATREAGWDLLALEDSPQGRWRLWGRRTFLNIQPSHWRDAQRPTRS